MTFFEDTRGYQQDCPSHGLSGKKLMEKQSGGLQGYKIKYSRDTKLKPRDSGTNIWTFQFHLYVSTKICKKTSSNFTLKKIFTLAQSCSLAFY